MLLKISIILLLIANIFFSNFKILVLIFLLTLILNIIYNKNILKHLKRIKILLLFYITTFIVQLYYGQQGQVLLKIYNFYITKEGLFNFGINFIRIINLILLSWVVNEIKFFKGRFEKYQRIIELVIELVPQAFTLFKKRMKLKYFYKHILKEIKERY